MDFSTLNEEQREQIDRTINDFLLETQTRTDSNCGVTPRSHMNLDIEDTGIRVLETPLEKNSDKRTPSTLKVQTTRVRNKNLVTKDLFKAREDIVLTQKIGMFSFGKPEPLRKISTISNDNSEQNLQSPQAMNMISRIKPQN